MLGIAPEKIKAFQMELLDDMARNHQEIIRELEETKGLTDELADKIVAAANEFKSR